MALQTLLPYSLLLGAALANPHLSRRQDGPVDPGTATDCTWYDTALDKTYTCQWFEFNWGLSHQDFVSYNPSVKDDCSGIKVGNSYCVEVNHGTPRPTTTTPTSTATPKPSPTQDGLIDTCTTFYMAVAGDTCDKIVAKYGTFTSAEFLSWNPAVGADCSGLWAKTYYCVGIPGTPTTKPSTTAVPTGVPSPTQSGLISTCNNFYMAVAGDTCDKIVAKYGTFTSAEFLSWNPAVGADCSGLQAKTYYCVGVPGTPTTKPTTTPTTTPTGPSPTQTGIISTCTQYHKAVDGEDCAGLVKQYGTFTLDQFLSWNHAVGADCSGFWLGYYYCVGVPGTPTTNPTTTPTTTPTGPSPTQTGIISTCTQYHKAVNGDDCAGLVKQYGTFTLDQFLSWNHAVGADCSGFWLGYYYCVGVPGTPTKPPTTTTAAGCANAPTPTQPGAICACNKWHKVANGDDCVTIEKQYGISAANFNKWNPQVGTSCSTLWLGYNVCVGA
ncbi:hypothetical protein Asppvi_000113 [Aspergillus pseudoviridinutans]|uniref:LysM domain-containing protein n=1 Tax=Aspergillus pseudoviridinutans TaxID=1517512 RepID=A0A9P3B4Y7_9EURO|nr:uncharacterized protein Asppvi_000113 [Aspergillus pseudoviridinutans]GIJ81614.1 hypothetical protein Asppvi_000113 [Aspergillus pseudoviridinutans]